MSSPPQPETPSTFYANVTSPSLSVACHAEQGARPYMEDTFLFHVDGGEGEGECEGEGGVEGECEGEGEGEGESGLRSVLLAVFDGHYGSGASTFLKEHFFAALSASPGYQSNLPEAFASTLKSLDVSLLEWAKKESVNGHARYDGSTCCCAVIRDDTIFIANLGDCRVVLLMRDGQVRAVTTDHCFSTNESEVKRVESLGWAVTDGRIDGKLEVSRALGDSYFKIMKSENDLCEDSPISCVPEVVEVPLTGVQGMIIASDGVWGSLSNEAAVEFVQQELSSGSDLPTVTKELVVHAIEEGSMDNTTAFVCIFGE
eukprot:TRINITY_DN20_c0_g1_i1.p1 TRINITY_DN20_c0_g1~~TRINITY_DN20_c0_g1_i1.p1  ORF type:complete len:315 (+),score=48.78 TRINITY_DN20_c0_g1_i1:34-978(+)